MPKRIFKPKQWFNLLPSGREEIRIYDDIGYWGITAENFRQHFLTLDKNVEIDLRINSYGGEVFDGFAIFNTILENESRFKSIGDGVAASISAYIPLAAKVRVAHSNARYMFHDPMVGIIGNSRELRKEANNLDAMRESLIARMLQLMGPKGFTKEKIMEIIKEETWFSAKQLLEVGLIDEIIDPIEVEEPETNTEIKIPKDIGSKVFVNFFHKNGGVMNKCPHCGKDIAEGSVFCNNCGKAIAQAPVIPQNPTPQQQASQREFDEARAQAAVDERNRIESIQAAGKKHKLPEDFVETLIKGGEAYEKCLPKILDKIGGLDPVPPQQQGNRVEFGADESDKFTAHASNCLLISAGYEKDKAVIEEAKKDVFINGLHTLMRVSLEKRGINHASLGAVDLVRKTFEMIGTGSSDLPAALEATVNKSLKAGVDGAPSTFNLWCGRREVADFKTNNIVQVSNFGDLKDLPEGGDFEDAKIADNKETYSISTKGRKYTISRNALVNDDMDVFSRIPYLMGRAVPRRINKDVYDALCASSLTGPLMADSVRLFNAAHSNMASANSGIPSVTSLSASEKLLMEMPLLKAEPDTATQYQNVGGKYIVTGSTNKTAILQVLGSQGMDISKSIVGVYNPFNLQNTICVFDSYLQYLLTTAGYGNAWYHVADQMDSETIGVAYLRGQTSPTMRRDTSRVGEALGILFDIFFDWGIYVADYRGIVYNDGATAG